MALVAEIASTKSLVRFTAPGYLKVQAKEGLGSDLVNGPKEEYCEVRKLRGFLLIARPVHRSRPRIQIAAHALQYLP
jgi:hypothetical protein